HKARSVIYLFIAICNIFISIPCIKAWGAKGAAIGTAISLIIGNGIFMNWYYHKKIKLDMVYFWGQIIKIFPSIFVVAILGFILKLILPMQNVAVLALTIVIYCMIYVIVVWLFGMNSSEKELFINPVKKVLKRFNG
ncbi:MAG: polysaccharide biosynthesis C-terminal domain-containing protein, partial [Clostridia bacterium]|nr:polysaccharide biosynthesis C-terminal domain-containing protein [Clostridia bacterium]